MFRGHFFYCFLVCLVVFKSVLNVAFRRYLGNILMPRVMVSPLREDFCLVLLRVWQRYHSGTSLILVQTWDSWTCRWRKARFQTPGVLIYFQFTPTPRACCHTSSGMWELISQSCIPWQCPGFEFWGLSLQRTHHADGFMVSFPSEANAFGKNAASP